LVPALGSSLHVGSLPPGVPGIPSLEQIFSLQGNTMGLIVAAIFGLTPTLVTTSLQRQVSTITEDLISLKPNDDKSTAQL
jgi:hypothetical protein